MKTVVVVLLGLLANDSALARSCDHLIDSAGVSSGDQIPALYAELATCDKKLAEERFDDFMRASGDVGNLVGLSMAAIDAEIYAPVWGLLEKVQDYSARDEVAKGVGAQCGDNPNVLPFLKGAYFGLGDRQFGQWREALVTCDTADLTAWLEEVVGAPPSISYDEKYSTVTDSLVKRQKAAALPVLEKAAIAAAPAGGPFNTIIDKMNDACRPEGFGASMSEEDRAKLEASLTKVAEGVPAEQAGIVADRLYQAGAEAAAAALLPSVYPDRVQGNGSLLYGVASVESCDGDAVVHYATVTDPAKRWNIADDVAGDARAFKPRLKCQAEGEWQVLTTPEPVANKSGVDSWAEGIAGEWQSKDLAVKTREEKGIALD